MILTGITYQNFLPISLSGETRIMKYTWLPFFSELFNTVTSGNFNKSSLADTLPKIFGTTNGVNDFDGVAKRPPLKEIDPFTFIALFNRGDSSDINKNKRIAFCAKARELFGLAANIPSDFEGIPTFSNQSGWLFPYEFERKNGEINTLWKLAMELKENKISGDTFAQALMIKHNGPSKLTQCFYIVRPNTYLPLDKNSKALLNTHGVSNPVLEADKTNLSWLSYLELLKDAKQAFSGKSFYEVSHDAWIASNDDDNSSANSERYWWMNCNPSIWDPRTYAIGETQTYTTHNDDGNKRRVYQYFTQVKPGDLIVGYVTTPIKEIATLHEVTRSIFTDGSGREVIEFKKIKDLSRISLEDLKNTPGFANAEPLKNNQGSLFSLTKEEFEIIDSNLILSKELVNMQVVNQSWMIGAGEGAKMWQEWEQDSIITIGWDEVGDLSALKSSELLKSKYLEIYSPEKDPVMNVKGLFEFAHKIRIGDIVFAKQGRSKWFGYGRVTSDYIHDPSRPLHKNYRRVQWIKTGEWHMPDEDRVTIKTLTNLSQYPEFLVRLRDLIDGSANTLKNTRPYDVNDALDELFISKDDFVSMLDGLSYKKNIVLQGPPGVGKTFCAKRLAFSLIGSSDESRIGFVQFHPSYSYEDFVQGIRPIDGGEFQVQDGLFLQFCNQARTSKAPFVVIIDEINRGNLAKIFGELLMLIESDKRSEKVHLTYSQNGETFSVPDNLYIIGTMNTADRSLSLIDYALRRRFLFFTLKSEILSKGFEEHLARLGVDINGVKWIQGKIGKLNDIIRNDTKNLGAGFEIGHSYFSHKPSHVSFKQWFSSILKHEIEPLLREYWYDDAEKVLELSSLLKAA